jgi:hypothetical protein
MRKLILIAAVPALVAFGAAASPDASKAPGADWMSVSQIAQKFEGMGYRIREINVDDGVYEIDATDANGARIEIKAHPVTGEIVRQGDDD